ncbi:hypothetical protein CMUS01_09706 [Colletotrichum musicola]|uniref:PSI domain-containing protein n=1 Tax=Colletotrichum musicola TaxID=2175873 RepID=A0A8H6K7Q2_9PEZI|nr:hypothetical protein CMUS01_09706 [Colletotrichum musicola]
MRDRSDVAHVLSGLEIAQLRENFTARETTDEHFFRCWQRQDCKACLKENQCGWCPMTSACVPNPYAIPLLAPAYNEDICPHWAERWELRTRPLGCQVSTITSLTSIISILSTLVVIAAVTLVVLLVRWSRRRSQEDPGWWRVWKYDWKQPFRRKARDGDRVGEHDPLLGENRDAQASQAP